ncbi:MAG: hypothetical protein ACTSR2_04885 [Candidatus Hodarchaeales archaeon]
MSNKVLIVYYVNKKIHAIIEHNEKRHPALGWHPLTVLEAKIDSAQQLLAHKNYDKARLQLADAITIIRNEIRRKKKIHTLDNRCEYKTKQYKNDRSSKCDKYPVTYYKGKYFCKKHLEQYKKDWKKARSTIIQVKEK